MEMSSFIAHRIKLAQSEELNVLVEKDYQEGYHKKFSEAELNLG